MDPGINLVLAAFALALEALIGYPAALLRAIGHPVMWIGALIGWLDRTLNRDTMPERVRRLNGVLAVVVLLAATVGPVLVVQTGLERFLPQVVVVVLLVGPVASLIAQRSLYAHVRAVADALEHLGLDAGREAVSHIVGRDPMSLDEAGVARAAIESLAENFSDGIVAPAFWCGLFGLPGIVFYKAVNTADSMIGHRTPRHRAFGWAAARLDDLINLPAARVAASWLVLAAMIHLGAKAARALRACLRDAGKHRSPNAGWPEAAMAGALGLRLAGPRAYGGTLVEDAWMGDGSLNAGPEHIRTALSLYRLGCGIQLACAVLLAFLIARG
jgi:adenosylcobinamide-phosphate synthase